MSSELYETVYTPESPLRRPVQMLKSMWKDLKVSKELAWRLTVRDISAMYRQSLLGITWAFLPPIAMTAAFVFLNQSKVLQTGSGGIPYPAFVLVGMVFWQLFTESLLSPLRIVTSAKVILVKVNFPREALMISAVLQTLFNFGIKFLLVIAVFAWYQLPVPWTVALIPFAVISLVVFGLVLGILLVPLGVLYNDVSQGLSIITTFWLFITPVAYTPGEGGLLASLARYNPVTPLVSIARDWMITGSFAHFNGFLLVSLLSLAAVFLGWVVYRISLPIILDKMSA